jgi:hypothetical protein
MSVSCECCVLSGRGLCDELVPRKKSPTECGVSKKCVIVKPRKMRRPRPRKGLSSHWKKRGNYRRFLGGPTRPQSVTPIIRRYKPQKKISSRCDLYWGNVLFNYSSKLLLLLGGIILRQVGGVFEEGVF